MRLPCSAYDKPWQMHNILHVKNAEQEKGGGNHAEQKL